VREKRARPSRKSRGNMLRSVVFMNLKRTWRSDEESGSGDRVNALSGEVKCFWIYIAVRA
jgi:hypothetical protein